MPASITFPDKKVEELRADVLEFYSKFQCPEPEEMHNRVHLGGFLSSPPMVDRMAPYLASALLTSDSIVLYDPIHYWFCEEQYKRSRLLSAPTGWLNPDTRAPDFIKTRTYLGMALSFLYSVRALIEAGIIVLVPVEKLVFDRISLLSECELHVKEKLGEVLQLTQKFPPEAVTVDDNRKGLFLFAGGNKREQIEKQIGHGVSQFSRDMLVTACTDSTYVAPFPWEQHLARESLSEFTLGDSHAKLIEALTQVQIPLLANLTPQVILDIHRGSGFSEFRTGLAETFRHIDSVIGSPAFVTRVKEIEKDILLPKVASIHKEVGSSAFLRHSAESAKEATLRFGATILAGFVSGAEVETLLTASSVTGGITFIQEMVKKRIAKGENRIWMKLIPDKPEFDTYIAPQLLGGLGNASWEIDDEPSMDLRCTRGLLKKPF